MHPSDGPPIPDGRGTKTIETSPIVGPIRRWRASRWRASRWRASRWRASRWRASRWRAASLISSFCLIATTVGFVSASPGTAAASIGTDKTKASQLEQLIANEGEVIQALVTRSDNLEANLVVVQKHVSSAQLQLKADHRSEATAALRMRADAIDAYVNASSGSSTLLGTSNASTTAEQQVYLDVASGVLNDAVATLETDQHRTTVAESTLRSEEAALATSLRQLATARQNAQNAITKDEALLSQVKGNLLHLILVANQRREAAQEQRQEELQAQAERAKAAAAAVPSPPVTQPSPPVTQPSPPVTQPLPAPAPGSYADPLRGIGGLSPERIDQGVDYSGYGPIYAIGDGIVLSTVNGGWPGGTFIAYRLTDGPARGLVVYAAEDIDPIVSVGESVTPATVLGQMYEGPEGIETGWADGTALGETMAAAYGQFSGSNSTAFGYNFSGLLEALGAPGGILQNDPPTGSVPSTWPSW